MIPAACMILENNLKISDLLVIWEAQVWSRVLRLSHQPDPATTLLGSAVNRMRFSDGPFINAGLKKSRLSIGSSKRQEEPGKAGRSAPAHAALKHRPNPFDQKPSQKGGTSAWEGGTAAGVKHPDLAGSRRALPSPLLDISCLKSFSGAIATSSVASVSASEARRLLKRWVSFQLGT